MKKTKIIATLGPSTHDKQTILELIAAGMNVARINMSHANHSTHQQKIDLLKEIRQDLREPLAILVDTKGPEVRLQKFENDSVDVRAGDNFHIVHAEVLGTKDYASITYKDLYLYISIGDTLLFCDGLIRMQVFAIKEKDIHLLIVRGGTLSNNKSINVPNVDLKLPYLSEIDKADIKFAIKNDADFIAASFVSTKNDMLCLKKFIKENGSPDIKIIAKIENSKGVENIEDIMPHCDGIMIARGDLGVEIPYERLPHIQKKIIKKALNADKIVIVATEMLESMIINSRPTRAETSDVANAIYDGTSAIMLSGETAIGQYPVDAVKVMSTIAEYTEQTPLYKRRFCNPDFKIETIADSISSNAVTSSIALNCSAILTITRTGSSPQMISRYRPICPIIAIALSKKTYYKLALSWGVIPIYNEEYTTFDELFTEATNICKKQNLLIKGDVVITLASDKTGKIASTNILRIDKIN